MAQSCKAPLRYLNVTATIRVREVPEELWLIATRRAADERKSEDAGTPRVVDHEETAQKIAACERKLAQHRAALDAGASPATVAGWSIPAGAVCLASEPGQLSRGTAR